MSEVEKAAQHLSQNDPVFAPLVAKYGLFKPRPHADYYHELVSSIISQQLSVRAASAIEKKFVALFDGTFPEPKQITETDIEVLRSAGLSRPKIGYIKDLAQHIMGGRLEINKLPSLSNDEIIKELVAVKGIGEWTAHMFLIFALGRLDVLPVGDLGVRTGVKNLYNFENLPSPQQVTAIAEVNKWRPYESVASWYIWRSLENTPTSG